MSSHRKKHLPPEQHGFQRACIQRVLLCTVIASLAALSCLLGPDSMEGYPAIPEAETSLIPDSVRDAYYRDASILACREAILRGENGIRLSRERIETSFNALLHIYNARQFEERDSVVRVHHIHASALPDPFTVIVTFDSSAAWSDDWRRGRSISGTADLDSLMVRYGLSPQVYYDWTPADGTRLTAEEPLNTANLSPLFLAIEGFREVRPVYTPKKTDIAVTPAAACLDIRFIRKLDNSRTYSAVFRVDDSGAVFLLFGGD